MAQSKLRGLGPVLPPKLVLPGGASPSWRGLSMAYAGSDVAASFSNSVEPIPFNTVYAETDGIRTTGDETVTVVAGGPYTSGDLTIATGTAGKVPAGMAGLWRLSCEALLNCDSSEERIWLFVNGGDPFYWTDNWSEPSVSPARRTFGIGPIVVELAEDDIVWAGFGSDTGSTVDGDGVDGPPPNFLLMEYVGTGGRVCETFTDQDEDVLNVSQPYAPGSTTVRSTDTGDSTDPLTVTWTEGAGTQEYDESDPATGEITLVGSRADPTGRVVVCYLPDV